MAHWLSIQAWRLWKYYVWAHSKSQGQQYVVLDNGRSSGVELVKSVKQNELVFVNFRHILDTIKLENTSTPLEEAWLIGMAR